MRRFLLKYINKKDMPSLAITMILSCLKYFLYEWSRGSALSALVCPVNESVWEQLKLLFFPYFFVSVWMALRSRLPVMQFFYLRLLGVSCGMLSIIMLYYSYTGIIGRHFVIVDIFIFLFGVLFACCLPGIFTKIQIRIPTSDIFFAFWPVVSLLFFVFTCFPPDIPLFFPPV